MENSNTSVENESIQSNTSEKMNLIESQEKRKRDDLEHDDDFNAIKVKKSKNDGSEDSNRLNGASKCMMFDYILLNSLSAIF